MAQQHSKAFTVICVYVPADHAESLKTAMFAAGAGRLGNYDCCAWQTGGTGQYRPLNGSNPFHGTQGDLELVEEIKIEMVVQHENLQAVIDALLSAHPYETPAYHYWTVNG